MKHLCLFVYIFNPKKEVCTKKNTIVVLTRKVLPYLIHFPYS